MSKSNDPTARGPSAAGAVEFDVRTEANADIFTSKVDELRSTVRELDDAEPAGDSDVRTKTVRGALWNYASFGGARLLSLLTTIVLARILAPSDFGVIALGLVILSYLEAFNDFGISSAIVYSCEDDNRHFSVVFWLYLLTGVLAAGFMSLLAIPVAALLDQPDLAPVIIVLSLSFVLSSLGGVHVAILKKRLQFKKLLPIDLTRAIVKAALAIALALAGFGVWSLVIAQIAGEVAGSAAAWWILPWRPSFVWDRTIVRGVLRYGSHIMGVALLAVVLTDIDYIIIGRRLGAEQLGYYSLGFRLPELAVMGICYAASGTIFPVLSSLRDDPASIRSGFSKALRVLTLLTVPVGLGIALTSRDFVATFYGDRWAETARVMPFIAAYAVLFSITFVCGDVYKAVGRPGLLGAMAGAWAPFAIATLLIAVPWGIVWVARVQLALMSVAVIVQIIVAHNVLDVPFRFFLRSTQSAILGGAAMAVVVLASRQLIGEMASPLRLLLTTLIGALTYLVVVSVLERPVINEVLSGLRARRVAT